MLASRQGLEVQKQNPSAWSEDSGPVLQLSEDSLEKQNKQTNKQTTAENGHGIQNIRI